MSHLGTPQASTCKFVGSAMAACLVVLSALWLGAMSVHMGWHALSGDDAAGAVRTAGRGRLMGPGASGHGLARVATDTGTGSLPLANSAGLQAVERMRSTLLARLSGSLQPGTPRPAPSAQGNADLGLGQLQALRDEAVRTWTDLHRKNERLDYVLDARPGWLMFDERVMRFPGGSSPRTPGSIVLSLESRFLTAGNASGWQENGPATSLCLLLVNLKQSYLQQLRTDNPCGPGPCGC